MKKENLLRLKKGLIISSLILGTSIPNTKSYASENLEFPKTYNKIEDIDSAINYYSGVFNLNETIIKDKLYEMTDNFNDYNWIYGNMINNKHYDNMEFAILDTIWNIYKNPEEYNLNEEKISSNRIYETHMTIEEMIYKYSNIYGINKEVALSIVYCECGSDVASSNYLDNNNPAGIGPYFHFLNKEVGVIYFCDMLKYDYNCKEDSNENFLGSIASTYCEIPDHWLSLTLPYYYSLKEDYLSYVSGEEKENIDIFSYEKKLK